MGCEHRIIWHKENTAPYDWDEAIETVNKECLNQCHCVQVKGHVYNAEHLEEVEHEGCDEPCTLNSLSFSCKARIEYSHDVQKEDWGVAIAKVNEECKNQCHCDELFGHTAEKSEERLEIAKKKGCDEKCDHGGTHHTCRQRMEWVKRNRAPHTYEAAKKQVNEECTAQ